MPEIMGGGGSIIGLITFGKVAEVLLFAAIGALAGTIIKKLWEYCEHEIVIYRKRPKKTKRNNVKKT